jgi:hypothetical protein
MVSDGPAAADQAAAAPKPSRARRVFMMVVDDGCDV